MAGDLVFLELQKTGGSHIRRLLERFLDGKPEGKHNRVTQGYSEKYLIGSIRNPWDWYVSLWAYGVSGKGAIRSRSCKGIDFSYYHRMLPKSMGKNWLTPREFVLSFYHDAAKPVQEWQRTYEDYSEPALFQAWLKLVLDPKRRFDIGEGFGFSPLSAHAGLMTYRYFRLFTLGDGVFKDKRMSDFDTIAEFDQEFNIIKCMIHTESLEEDFIQVLNQIGLPLSDEQLRDIRSKEVEKTNVSKRKSAGFYYDEETLELVRERDRYLVEKYDYNAPDYGLTT